MARYACTRCGADCNTLDPPHLCKDVTARLRRRKKQKEAVLDILRGDTCVHSCLFIDKLAEDIVNKLAQLGVQED